MLDFVSKAAENIYLEPDEDGASRGEKPWVHKEETIRTLACWLAAPINKQTPVMTQAVSDSAPEINSHSRELS